MNKFAQDLREWLNKDREFRLKEAKDVFEALDEFFSDKECSSLYHNYRLDRLEYNSEQEAKIEMAKRETKAEREARLARFEKLKEIKNYLVEKLLETKSVVEVAKEACWSVEQTLAFARARNIPIKQ